MNSLLHKEIEERMSNSDICYVLITCERKRLDGSLQVEMSHTVEDPVLASYLLSNAQAYIDEKVEEEFDS